MRVSYYHTWFDSFGLRQVLPVVVYQLELTRNTQVLGHFLSNLKIS